MNFDPTIEASILQVLGLDPNSLSNGYIYNRAKDVVKYFSSKPNPRAEVLKLIARKNGNPLDVAWTYVQLQKEKEAMLSKLNPEDFEPDVAAEIVSKHITIEKKQRVREDIKKQKELLKKQKAEQELTQANQEKVHQIFSETKLDYYDEVFNEIDRFDKELSYYG